MALQDDLDTPFALAIRKVGSLAAFARLIGRAQSTVHERLQSGEPLWAENGTVLKVEAATGVSRYELRPDIYPIEPPASAGSRADPRAAPSGAASASSSPPGSLGDGGADVPSLEPVA